MKNLIFILCLSMAGAIAPPTRQNAAGFFNPDWSPDGGKIAFESTKSGKYAVYTIKADGTDLQKLTADDSDNDQPAWSPDGQQIVFVSRRDGHRQIYLMNADGSGQRRLTDSPD